MEYLVNSGLTTSISGTMEATLSNYVVLVLMMNTWDSSKKFLITNIGCSYPMTDFWSSPRIYSDLRNLNVKEVF